MAKTNKNERMKKILFLFLLIAATGANAQTKDEQRILSILDAQTNYWNAGDLENFMKGYWKSDSLMFIGKSGVTYGYNNTLENYKKGYPTRDAMGILKFTILKVEKISADAYFVVGKWHLTREKVGDVEGHYTLLFKQIKGEWVIVADHSS
jgi:ketosteroid isomerase-like protein